MSERHELEIDLWARAGDVERAALTLLTARRATTSKWPEAATLKSALDALHDAKERLREHLLVLATPEEAAELAETPEPAPLDAAQTALLDRIRTEGSASTPNGSPEAATACALNALGYVTEAASGDDYMIWVLTPAGVAAGPAR